MNLKSHRITTRLWKQPTYRKKVTAAIRKACRSKKRGLRISKKQKKLWADPKYRKRVIAAMQRGIKRRLAAGGEWRGQHMKKKRLREWAGRHAKRIWRSKARRKRMSRKMRDRWKTEETRRRHTENHHMKQPKWRRWAKRVAAKQPGFIAEQDGKNRLGKPRPDMQTPEARERGKIRMEEAWKDPEKAAKFTATHFNEPSSYEKKVEFVIQENDLPFMFVGIGGGVIDGLAPDFIGIGKAEDVILEPHFSRYEGKKVRIQRLIRKGYRVVYLDERTLDGPNWYNKTKNRIIHRLKRWGVL